MVISLQKECLNRLISLPFYVDGVGLLCCDDKVRCSYDLTKEENCIVNRSGFFIKKNFVYYKTNVRLERPLLYQLGKMCKNDTLVVFGHEWGVLQWEKICYHLFGVVRILNFSHRA